MLLQLLYSTRGVKISHTEGFSFFLLLVHLLVLVSTVIVKLDIDTPHVEVAMVQQLLKSPELLKLVDVFYFEHHVHLWELAYAWGSDVEGSVLSSLELFAALREKGVDAHFWV